MVSNGPLGVFVKVGAPQNGKQEYQISLPNRNGEIETRSAHVDEKNVDKFDKLNVDCIIAASEINRKMAKGSLIGSLIGGIIPFVSSIAIAKKKWVGAVIGIITAIAGGVVGMFTGSYIAAKKVIPEAKQRIEQNEQQMQMLIEK